MLAQASLTDITQTSDYVLPKKLSELRLIGLYDPDLGVILGE